LKKSLKYLFWGLLLATIAINLAIVFTGKTYLYTGISHLLQSGKFGPGISDFNKFPKREIPAGIPAPWHFASDYNAHSIEDSLLKAIEEYETVAYLIIKDDSIKFEKYWNGYSEKSHSNSFSMAKSIVSILTGIAIKEGRIQSLEQPVSDFIPEFRGTKKATIKIKDLLSMSSGIDFDEDYVNPLAYPAAAYYGTSLKNLTLNYQAKEKPGTIFRYLSGDTQLMALTLQAATGKSLAEYASEKLWKPIGAENTAYWSTDTEEGIEKAYCCFISNARDFARFGKLYLNKGNWEGSQIVDTSFVEESIKPAALKDSEGKPNNKYGLSWWLLPDYKGHNIFYARGILGQYIICIPDKKMVIVRLGHKRAPKSGDSHPKDLAIYLEAALKMYN
jgi:CubicO group peptidase (beta-lactamase class C family)